MLTSVLYYAAFNKHMSVISTLDMLLVDFLMFAALGTLFDCVHDVEQLDLSPGLKCSYSYDLAVSTHHKKPNSD